MEVLFEAVSELVLSGYYEFVDKIFGDKKLKKWQEVLLKILYLAILPVALLLVLLGAFWVSDIEPFKTYGVICIAVGGAILFVLTLRGIVATVSYVAEKRSKQESEEYAGFEENNPAPQIRYIETNDNEEDVV